MPKCPRYTLFLALVLTLASTLMGLGCGRDDPLARFAPQLDPDIRALLDTMDDDVFIAMALEMGEPRLIDGWYQLILHVVDGTPGTIEVVEPHARRLALLFRDHFGTGFRLHEIDVLAQIDPSDLAPFWARWQNMTATISEDDPEEETKALELESLAADAITLGIDWFKYLVDEILARNYAHQGRLGDAQALFENTLDYSVRVEDVWSQCQVLGTLAELHYQANRPDSTYICLDRAEHIARRSKLAFQLARILAFRADYLRDSGHYGSAHLLLREARRECRALKGRGRELRWLLAEIDFLDQLGCWPIIDDLVAEGEILAAQLPHYIEPRQIKWRSMKLRLTKVRSLAAHGQQSDARRLMDDLLSDQAPLLHPELRSEAMSEDIEMLITEGRMNEARKRAEEGLAHASENHIELQASRFEILLARIALAESDFQEGRLRLNAFITKHDHLQTADLEAESYAADMNVRIAAAVGNESELVEALGWSFTLLDSLIVKSDHSVATYLAIDQFDRLRATVHGLIADDPSLGLAFENHWRSLIGHHHRSTSESASQFVTNTQTAAEWISAWSGWQGQGDFADRAIAASNARSDAINLLAFVVTDDAVIRWHSENNEIHRSLLEVTPEDLRTQTAQILDRLSSKPQPDHRRSAPSLQQLLMGMSRTLLPESYLETPPSRLIVMPDDMLNSLPFGVLSTSTGLPLGHGTDIVRLRYESTAAPRSQEPSLVVANPSIAMDIQRLYSGLTNLPGAEAEGLTTAALLANSQLLLGADADKAAVIHGARSASRLYFASHIVQDATAPFLKFIPLASGANHQRVEDSVLEMKDILDLDLSGCGLVVLSGCSSGTPYVTDVRTAPSFGDVFLDAGASNAVQCLWRVDDGAMVPIMESFVKATADNADVWHLAASLREARAPLMIREGLPTHPFGWGALILVTTDPGF